MKPMDVRESGLFPRGPTAVAAVWPHLTSIKGDLARIVAEDGSEEENASAEDDTPMSDDDDDDD